eukprot:6181836-Pleurochrysis_carterae.AAC.1
MPALNSIQVPFPRRLSRSPLLYVLHTYAYILSTAQAVQIIVGRGTGPAAYVAVLRMPLTCFSRAVCFLALAALLSWRGRPG